MWLMVMVRLAGDRYQHPSSPHLIGSCDTPGDAYGVAISGTCAYVADGDSGLQVIDISTPSSPHLIGSCDTPGYA